MMMVPVVVFFGIATVAGCVVLAIVTVRLRAVSQRPQASEAELCQLKQANRISSVAVVASLGGL
ncbi:MAG: hypothetical protein ACJ72Y_08985, partial [Actinomycetes bacterium]